MEVVIVALAPTMAGEKGEVPAYEVTLKAVLPEGMVPALLSVGRSHTLRVAILGPKPEVGA